MAESAKKLPPEKGLVELPPLEPGDRELAGLIFATRMQLGTSSIILGRTYDWGFDLSGTTARIVAKKNGTASVHIRMGANVEGDKVVGGRYREVIFYPNGMYGAAVDQ